MWGYFLASLNFFNKCLTLVLRKRFAFSPYFYDPNSFYEAAHMFCY